MYAKTFSLKITSFLSALFVFIGCNVPDGHGKNKDTSTYSLPSTPTQFVFETTNLKQYKFPTHINEIVVDRAYSKVSEVFMVVVEPGKTVMHHKHTDTEQVFYMIKGSGNLLIGENKQPFAFKPGDVIRIPVSTLHSVESVNNDTIEYLCVDCFTQKPLEPTWEEHVKVVCENNNWNYESVIASQN